MEYIIHSRRNRNCLGVIEESSGLLCPERPRLAAHSAYLIETGHLYICHYSDVIMSMMASQITGVMIVYSTVCSGTGQRKHQSSASLAYVRGIHRWPVNSPHKGPVTWRGKCFHLMTSSCFVLSSASDRGPPGDLFWLRRRPIIRGV